MMWMMCIWPDLRLWDESMELMRIVWLGLSN